MINLYDAIADCVAGSYRPTTTSAVLVPAALWDALVESYEAELAAMDEAAGRQEAAWAGYEVGNALRLREAAWTSR